MCVFVCVFLKALTGVVRSSFFVVQPHFRAAARSRLRSLLRCAHSCLKRCCFYSSPYHYKVSRGLATTKAWPSAGAILVCHLSRLITADHGLIKTSVLTVRALPPINALGHLLFPR